MKNSRFFVIALLSATLISLEIVWTRVFSAEFFYTFAFLTLSLAVLGLGFGALLFRLLPFLDRKHTIGSVLTISSLLALAGPSIVLNLHMEFSRLFSSWEMVWKFVLTVFLLSSPFMTGGIALAKIFRDDTEEMPRLYMADLLGAGLGGLLAVLFMNFAGTQYAAFLICVPMISAALWAYEGKLRLIAVIPLAAMVVLMFYANTLMNPPMKERAPVIAQHWDAMAKLKILEFGKEDRGINIDNVANTPVIGFDGNWKKLDSAKYDFGIFQLKSFIVPGRSVTLSLGAGGGGEVFQALKEGAREIHAVEVNPEINRMISQGELARFSGNIYNDPRVKVISEDGRTYVKRFRNKFDLITSFSSNTFAALASGSFALAENYLFTTEAYQDYLNALTDSGYFYMEHQMYMPKVVTEVLEALGKAGIKDPASHIAVYDLPKFRRNIIIFSRRPLTDQFRQTAVYPLTAEVYPYIHLLYPAPDSTKNNLINQIVQKGWRNIQNNADIDIAPCYDDRPYIAQLGLWKNFSPAKLKQISPYEFKGFPVSKMIVVMILIIISVLVLPMLFLPYLFRGKKLNASLWLYYFAIGVAYMVVEIVLIQRYTLFIGASSYSFIIILLSLLISSGIGSRFSERFNDLVPFAFIISWVVLELFAFAGLREMLSGSEFYLRTILSVLLIFPLGFFMGMPFPKAAKKAGELVDWGFAVNGVASVIGSAGIILVSINFGLSISLLTGAVFYMLAMYLLNRQHA